MSTEAIDWVFYGTSPADTKEFAVLVALAHRCPVNSNQVDVSIGQLVAVTRLQKRTVARALHSLRDAGYLKLHNHGRGFLVTLPYVPVRVGPTSPVTAIGGGHVV